MFQSVELSQHVQRQPNSRITLVSQIVKRIENKEHSTKFAENLIAEYKCYSIHIATNKRTPDIFLTAWIVKHIDY